MATLDYRKIKANFASHFCTLQHSYVPALASILLFSICRAASSSEKAWLIKRNTWIVMLFFRPEFQLTATKGKTEQGREKQSFRHWKPESCLQEANYLPCQNFWQFSSLLFVESSTENRCHSMTPYWLL